MPKYLVGRVVDPVLGLATGALAYVLWENDGRNAEHRPEGRKLVDLVQRKWQQVPPPPELLQQSKLEDKAGRADLAPTSSSGKRMV
ncbi:unnamed protein product [Parajaminaea phylloscopi]